jgi:tripartite ATP-independent transporter DctM subunit
MLEGLILLVILLILIFAGVPVALAMGATGMVGVFVFGPGIGPMIIEIGRVIWYSNLSFLLTAIVFFFLMAEFILRGGLAESLFEGLSKLSSGIRGSLSVAVIFGCALFGLTTGSGMAEIAAIGRISVPSMLKRGYDKALTLGGIAASGSLGFLVPPSLFLIIYGAWAGASVAELFAAGLIPGFVMAAFMIVQVVIRVNLNPKLAPKMPPAPAMERAKGLLAVWPVVIVGMTVLGLIFTGVATPTESAGIGAVFSLLIILARPRSRKLVNLNFLKDSFLGTVRLTSALMFIITGAFILSFAWGFLGVPVTIAKWVAGLALPPLAILLLIYLLNLILGTVVDALSMMLLTLPITLPLVLGLGYDPIWYGVMLGVLIGCAQITPPVGIGLFTVKTIFPEHGFGTIVRGAMPFLVAELACLALLTAFPEITLWLPRVLFWS